MNTLFRHRFFLCLLLFLPITITVHAESQLTLESAINKAGRQRMLSQRIVVKYAQIGQALFIEEARREMDQNVELFASQLDELKGMPQYSEVQNLQETLDWVTLKWQRFRAMTAGEVSQDKLKELNYLSEDLLYGSNKVVLILQDLQNKPVHRLVNISGRQRMLSQHMAKLYLLRSWGFSSMSTDDYLERAEREMDFALQTLKSAAETNSDTQELLEMAAVQWTWFRSVLSGDLKGGDYRLIVVDTSNNLLEILEHITQQYEQLASVN